MAGETLVIEVWVLLVEYRILRCHADSRRAMLSSTLVFYRAASATTG